MSLPQAIFLAIVQGITEFLPISSSGHLVLFQKLFMISTPPVLFDVLLHLGTLFAIIIFFWKDLVDLVINWEKNKKIWIFLIIGSIPAALVGLVLNSKINAIFNSLFLVGIMWIVFGLAVIILFKSRFNKNDHKRVEGDITPTDGLIIGSFQAFALFPGISRSGSTIIGGLWQKLSRETAFKISFFLSIPAILGATILKFKDGRLDGITSLEGIMAIVISAIVGYFSLKILKKILLSNKFYYFGLYCLILGILVLSKIIM